MRDFSRFIDDYSYYNTPDRFGPLGKQQIGGTMEEPVFAETGVKLDKDGHISFRFYYPDNEELVVTMRAGRQSRRIPLVKDESGFFSGTLLYDENDPSWRGFRTFGLEADGIPVVSSRAPLSMGGRGPEHNFEVPIDDFDEYLMDRKVSRGAFGYRIFWSEVTSSWHRLMIYTPAEYNHSPEKHYPVLYLHHPGSRNNDSAWMFSGKVPLIMDNLIAEGKANPFIVVSLECGPQLEEDGLFGMDGYFRMLFEDIIPFIESEYRCLNDKWNRAAAGASWGGMLSSQLVARWPDMFASVGMLSSGIRCVDSWKELKDNHYLDWMVGNAAQVEKQYKLIFRSHGEIEYIGRPDLPGETGNYTLFEDEEWLRENGIDQLPCYHRVVFKDGKHMWDTFARGFCEFARLLFR